jgi:hypothetical protein
MGIASFSSPSPPLDLSRMNRDHLDCKEGRMSRWMLKQSSMWGALVRAFVITTLCVLPSVAKVDDVIRIATWNMDNLHYEAGSH